jgi:GNAT superfamily N-acetyltransferase
MITVRTARRADAETLFTLIDALADYEKLDRPTQAARAHLLADGFERTPPRFEALIAEHDGIPVGYSILFETYSSFLAQPSLYIEDLFVLPDQRRHGAGDALFRYLCAESLRRGCGRLEWVCLDWNALAIGFYEKRGGVHLDDWRSYRLTAPEIERLLAGGTV